MYIEYGWPQTWRLRHKRLQTNERGVLIEVVQILATFPTSDESWVYFPVSVIKLSLLYIDPENDILFCDILSIMFV